MECMPFQNDGAVPYHTILCFMKLSDSGLASTERETGEPALRIKTECGQRFIGIQLDGTAALSSSVFWNSASSIPNTLQELAAHIGRRVVTLLPKWILFLVPLTANNCTGKGKNGHLFHLP